MNTFTIKWYTLLFFALPLSPYISSVYSQNRVYTTQKIEGEVPRIDGIIDEAAWDAVDWTGNFTQTEPYENQPPSQPTEFKVLYDNNNLYFAIYAYDSSPDSIEKRMSRRDGYEGDFIEVTMDSYHDERTGFEFTVNAAGVKGDAKITNDNNFDESWDPIWYVKTNITDKGWVAEMRIPLSQLRFGKQDEYVWGFQVLRRLFRHEERSAWQFISPQASGWVSNFGELHGIRHIVPRKQKDITPYVVGKIENYERDNDDPFADGRDYAGSIGLDGKIGITNDLTLDFTINPDFGQVEADPSEVNLSTFETFFPERRAFFIEGKNILSHRVTPVGPFRNDNLFYSRRVGRSPGYWPDTEDDEYLKMPKNTTILGAFKLTGKTKKGLSIGVMESITQLEQADIAREYQNGTGKNYEYRKEPVEPFTNYFAARIEQDFNSSNSRIGAMVTATNRDLHTTYLKDNMHSAAYTGGINFNHQWKDKTYYIDANIVAGRVQGTKEAISNTQTNAPHFLQRVDAKHVSVDSNRTSLTGTGGSFTIGKAGNGKWRFANWITYRSPQLNLNDMGFMVRNDEIQQIFWVQYRENEPKAFYRRFNVNFNQWFGLTTGAEYRYLGFNVNGFIQYKNFWASGLGGSRDLKSLSTNELRGGPSLLYDGYTDFFGWIGSDYRKKVHVEFGGSGGVADRGTSIRRRAWVDINLRISDAFKLSLAPALTAGYGQVEYVINESFNDEERYIRAHMKRTETSLTVRFTYNISPDFTIQYYAMPFISIGDYTAFKYVNNSTAPEFEDRFTNYTDDQIEYTDDGETINVYESGRVPGNDSQEPDYSFDNPNFRALDFNSNLVLRWEYLPGSTVYLVWTQQRSEWNQTLNNTILEDGENLFTDTYPHDIFLAKFSYRFGI